MHGLCVERAAGTYSIGACAGLSADRDAVSVCTVPAPIVSATPLKSKMNVILLIIGLCILLRVYQLNIGITSVRNKVFLVLDFIVHLSHYMFRPLLAAIFRWFANTQNIYGSHYILNGSVE
jgi:hypothetical protein